MSHLAGTIKLVIVAVLGGIALSANPAMAEECGPEPTNIPVVPDGSTVSREEIVEARKVVIAYSDKVDEYIACMDRRKARLAPYMTKEAQERYDEDLNKVANKRTEIQVAINKAIREYRRRREDG